MLLVLKGPKLFGNFTMVNADVTKYKFNEPTGEIGLSILYKSVLLMSPLDQSINDFSVTL